MLPTSPVLAAGPCRAPSPPETWTASLAAGQPSLTHTLAVMAGQCVKRWPLAAGLSNYQEAPPWSSSLNGPRAAPRPQGEGCLPTSPPCASVPTRTCQGHEEPPWGACHPRPAHRRGGVTVLRLAGPPSRALLVGLPFCGLCYKNNRVYKMSREKIQILNVLLQSPAPAAPKGPGPHPPERLGTGESAPSSSLFPCLYHGVQSRPHLRGC